jgi:prepilin-type N-terminal cleavage/methylation domain-containing protein
MVKMKFSHPVRAFTLIEMMIVTTVIGLLVAIAVPTFINAREHSRNSVYIANLRAASGAFINYATDNKQYPPTGTAGIIPAGMESYLTNFRWTAPTPIGGQWAWDYDVHGYKAGISVSGPTIPPRQIEDIDRVLDDGNINTGQFRARPGGYVYIIED